MNTDPAHGHPHDVWTGGDAYERYVGRWGRLVARHSCPGWASRRALKWLDVGCGTGALTATIVELAEPAAVLGVDPSEAFLAHARDMLGGPRVSFQVGDAEALPAPDGSYDVVVAGLVLNFVPDARAALAEWRRVTRAGGAIGGYVWDYAGQMQLPAISGMRPSPWTPMREPSMRACVSRSPDRKPWRARSSRRG